MFREIQQKITERCALDKEELIFLLGLPSDSAEIAALGAQTRKKRETTGNVGKIWGAIGLDYRACEMNCHFCSLGSDIHPSDQIYELSREEVMNAARRYAEKGVDWLVLRTTEKFPLEELLAVVRAIKTEVPGDFRLVVNTGNEQSRQVEALKRAGVEMMYHAVRLREGVDTRFCEADRQRTQESIRQNGLLLSQYLEPIGPEHTDEELAERMLAMIRQDTDVMGIMTRVPVKGTVKEMYPAIDAKRTAQITAVLQAADARREKDVIIHPFCEEALRFGANALVVDIGAIPRAKGISFCEWDGQDVDLAKQRLQEAGYKSRK